jgi:predicted RNase H-like nuclease
MATLVDADPPLILNSHPETRDLLATSSPLEDRPYKHREDLLDAALCAWTASLWARWGTERCQVLGEQQVDSAKAATIIAPARQQQRR